MDTARSRSRSERRQTGHIGARAAPKLGQPPSSAVYKIFRRRGRNLPFISAEQSISSSEKPRRRRRRESIIRLVGLPLPVWLGAARLPSARDSWLCGPDLDRNRGRPIDGIHIDGNRRSDGSHSSLLAWRGVVKSAPRRSGRRRAAANRASRWPPPDTDARTSGSRPPGNAVSSSLICIPSGAHLIGTHAAGNLGAPKSGPPK